VRALTRIRHVLHASVGRRGAFLASHGVLYLLYGFGLATAVPNRPPARRVLYSLIEAIAPIRWWGVLWMLTGLLAIVSAGSCRWRMLRALAFSGLMGLAMLWALGLGAADLAPGVSGTSSWIAGSLFLALAVGTAVVAGWVEETK
jgi:hypothetical protein